MCLFDGTGELVKRHMRGAPTHESAWQINLITRPVHPLLFLLLLLLFPPGLWWRDAAWHEVRHFPLLLSSWESRQPPPSTLLRLLLLLLLLFIFSPPLSRRTPPPPPPSGSRSILTFTPCACPVSLQSQWEGMHATPEGSTCGQNEAESL